MQIVIELDEERYKDILRISTVQLKKRTPTLEQVIANGIPIQKGHGDLIDRNVCLAMKSRDLVDADGVTMYAVPTGNILRIDAVIPADKEDCEGE